MNAKELQDQLTTLREQYHNDSQGGKSVEVLANQAQKIKELNLQLSSMLAEGAKNDPITGEKPIGMKVSKGVYEVGSLGTNLRSRGESVEEAVQNWNAGNYWTNPINPDEAKQLPDLLAKIGK